MAFIMLFPTVMSSKAAYLPVLTHGKSWEVACYNDKGVTEILNIFVDGDTLVKDRTCKKIKIVSNDDSRSPVTAVAFEEDGKVWNVEDGSLKLLFDINLNEGDVAEAGCVIKSDVITVNEQDRKRLVIDSGVDGGSEIEYLYYVVEGVGINTDRFLWYTTLTGEGKYSRMLSCKENGETIFTYKDFSKNDSETLRADLTGDGKVDIADVNALINIILSN